MTRCLVHNTSPCHKTLFHFYSYSLLRSPFALSRDFTTCLVSVHVCYLVYSNFSYSERFIVVNELCNIVVEWTLFQLAKKHLFVLMVRMSINSCTLLLHVKEYRIIIKVPVMPRVMQRSRVCVYTTMPGRWKMPIFN